MFRRILTILFILLNVQLVAKTTGSNGNTYGWCSSSSWTNGVPNQNKDVITINPNDSINASCISGTIIFGAQSQLYVKSGAVLVLGSTQFNNGCIIQIDSGGIVIINGNLFNSNNSNNITINGILIVNGVLTNGTNSEIVGGGTIAADSITGDCCIMGLDPDSIQTTYNEPPTTSDLIVCKSDTTSQLYSIGTNIKWYDSAYTYITDTNYIIPYSYGYSAPNTYSFYATQTVLGLESDPDTVYYTIRDDLEKQYQISDSTLDANICIGYDGYIELKGWGAGKLYSIDSGNTFVTDSVFNPVYSGVYSCYIKDSMGCISNIVNIIIDTIFPVPPFAPSVNACYEQPIPPLIAYGKDIYWYYDQMCSAEAFIGDTFYTGDSLVGIYEYYVVQLDTNAGCQSPAYTVSLTIDTICLVEMPVDLLYFKSKIIGEFVFIEWATATEVNNYYFSVGRSQDMINWIEIVKVFSTGNKNNISKYSVSDYRELNTSYYRLSQTDTDGNTRILSHAVITEPGFGTLSILPNPAASGEYIILCCFNIFDIRIYDIYGTPIKFVYESNKIQLDSPGVYFVRINQKFTKKLIIK